MEDPGGGSPGHQPLSAPFFQREIIPGAAEKHLCARTQLLLLSGGIGAPKYQVSYYILGILLFFGVLLGRAVCGFLCPFGWFQELLHKIPTKKFTTWRLHWLTYLKYGILVLFVIVLPMTVVNEVGLADPFFCKYICPAGILEGGIPLALANESIRASLGALFTWKSCVLLGIVLLAVFFYRPFCKWICPLGLFHKVSLYRLSVDGEKCTACGVCSGVCGMDVDVFRHPNHAECIRCGDCIRACPHQAIQRQAPWIMKEKRSANHA